MSFKVRVIGDEEEPLSEVGADVMRGFLKNHQKKMSFWQQKAPKKKSIYKTSGVCVRNSASGKDDWK